MPLSPTPVVSLGSPHTSSCSKCTREGSIQKPSVLFLYIYIHAHYCTSIIKYIVNLGKCFFCTQNETYQIKRRLMDSFCTVDLASSFCGFSVSMKNTTLSKMTSFPLSHGTHQLYLYVEPLSLF